MAACRTLLLFVVLAETVACARPTRGSSGPRDTPVFQPPNALPSNPDGFGATVLLRPSSAGEKDRAEALVALPPDSFPSLPLWIVHDLRAAGCVIPQMVDGAPRNNVLTGAFLAPGESDVAALCLAGDTASVLVFGTDTTVGALRVAAMMPELFEGHGRAYGGAPVLIWKSQITIIDSAQARTRCWRKSFGSLHEGIINMSYQDTVDVYYWVQSRQTWVSCVEPDGD